MLQQLQLHNFKGFHRFTIRFDRRAILVGPNNAGKSTAIGAVRAIAGMRRRSGHQQARRYIHDKNLPRWGWTIPAGYGASEENLRFDFLSHTVRVSAKFSGGTLLEAVWPGEESDESPDEEVDGFTDPYFYILDPKRESVRQPARIRGMTPEIGIVPLLTPVDFHELTRSRDTVVRNLSGRLASRQFRNQLLLMAHEPDPEGRGTKFDAFCRFIEPWLLDTRIDPPITRTVDGGTEIDVYFYERRRPRELAWAGDGYQVFIQLLYHCFRLKDVDTIVLDEPDVYLHPDLQRRLFQVVDDHQGQVIFASHSSELVAEAPPSSVIWVDRTRTKAIRSPDPKTLDDLSKAIGSGFNLRLARVLRAKAVLFVEGEDVTILRLLARTLTFKEVVSEARLVTVALGGVANKSRLESFGWISEELLKGSIRGFVLLDRDYRSSVTVDELERQLDGFGLRPHVWRRKELESYLLETPAVARVVGSTEEWIDKVLDEESSSLRAFVQARLVGAQYEDRGRRGINVTTVAQAAAEELETFWDDARERRWRCPAKELITALNRRAQSEGKSTVNAYGLAKELRIDEISAEMSSVLERINDAVASDS